MSLHLKPKFLRDIGSRKKITKKDFLQSDVFSFRHRRVNLHYTGTTTVFPAVFFLRIVFIFTAVSFLLLGSVFAPTALNRASGQSSDEERAMLEAQLLELEEQMSEYENQIVSYQKQGKTFKDEIIRLNDRVAKLNLQIQAIGLTVKDLDFRITDTKIKIVVTEDTIDSHRAALGRLFQGLYENERASLVEIFLRNPEISDFFDRLRGMALLQNGLRLELQKIKDLRDELGEQNEQLNLARADAESAKSYSNAQRAEISSVKSEKNRLLEITKGQESKYQELLEQTQETAAEIRKRIFRLFGGGELSFEEAYNLAEVAEKATGVRAALILAILDQESKLGRNVGQCAPESAMHPTRDLTTFNKIVDNLIVNGEFVPQPLLVSCPIRAHGAYGGAMGPAQFIPSTWVLYEKSITKITGNNPPSPWRNADAFVATALYLKNSLNSSSCKNYASRNREILPYQFLLERCAGAQYYAGGNWYTYRFVYGDPVIEKAERFQEDINSITS